MTEKTTYNSNNNNKTNNENNIFNKINFQNVKTEINIGNIVCNEKNNGQTQKIIFEIPFTNTPKLAIYFKSINQPTLSNIKYLSCNISNCSFDFQFNYLNDKINLNEFIIEYIAIYHIKKSYQPGEEKFFVKNRFVSKM
ncbi:hypothetical protein ACTFIZ_000671 [Dictyostelium cf. discoideum]